MDGKVMRETLKKCFEELGAERFKNKAMLTSAIRDFLPGLSHEDERDFFCEIINKFNLSREFPNIGADEEGRKHAYNYLLNKITKSGIYQREAVELVLQSFAFALWGFIPESERKIEEKKINPDVFVAKNASQKSAYEKSLLAEVVIPGNISKIDEGAFRDCKDLIKVVISEGVKEIGQCAFAGCENLISLSVPGSVTKIEDDVFSGCSRLELVTYGGVPYKFADFCSTLKKREHGENIQPEPKTEETSPPRDAIHQLSEQLAADISQQDSPDLKVIGVAENSSSKVPMMSFWGAIKSCLIDNYATCQGRARRREYWYFKLFTWIVFFIGLLSFPGDIKDHEFVSFLHFTSLTLMLIHFSFFVSFFLILDCVLSTTDSVLFTTSVEKCFVMFDKIGFLPNETFCIIFCSIWLLSVIPDYCVTMRRLHDVGESGEPECKKNERSSFDDILYNFLFGSFIYLFDIFRDSMPGTNQYGPNPKGIQKS